MQLVLFEELTPFVLVLQRESIMPHCLPSTVNIRYLFWIDVIGIDDKWALGKVLLRSPLGYCDNPSFLKVGIPFCILSC